jgi:hypothetical protein
LFALIWVVFSSILHGEFVERRPRAARGDNVLGTSENFVLECG